MKHKFKLGAKVEYKSVFSNHWVNAVVVRLYNTYLPQAYSTLPEYLTSKYAIQVGEHPSLKIMRKWADEDMLRSRDET